MTLMTLAQETQLQATLTTAYQNYARKLNKYAFFKVHDPAMSEDLVQNTFMKTWSYLMKGGKIATMKAFLYHILNNLIVDEYRKHKTSSLDVLLEKGIEPGTDNSEQLMNVLDGKTVLILIHRLPVKYQKVMRMRYIRGLSLEEMSRVLRQSKNTVAVQLHRGIKKLRLMYNQNTISEPNFRKYQEMRVRTLSPA